MQTRTGEDKKPLRWGGNDLCPGCHKTVYPTDRVYAADRKPFHKKCVQCQVKNCRNELTEKGIHRHDGINCCDRCNEQLGLGPGGESLDTARNRMAQEKAAREARIQEIEEMRRRITSMWLASLFPATSQSSSPKARAVTTSSSPHPASRFGKQSQLSREIQPYLSHKQTNKQSQLSRGLQPYLPYLSHLASVTILHDFPSVVCGNILATIRGVKAQ